MNTLQRALTSTDVERGSADLDPNTVLIPRAVSCGQLWSALAVDVDTDSEIQCLQQVRKDASMFGRFSEQSSIIGVTEFTLMSSQIAHHIAAPIRTLACLTVNGTDAKYVDVAQASSLEALCRIVSSGLQNGPIFLAARSCALQTEATPNSSESNEDIHQASMREKKNLLRQSQARSGMILQSLRAAWSLLGTFSLSPRYGSGSHGGSVMATVRSSSIQLQQAVHALKQGPSSDGRSMGSLSFSRGSIRKASISSTVSPHTAPSTSDPRSAASDKSAAQTTATKSKPYESTRRKTSTTQRLTRLIPADAVNSPYAADHVQLRCHCDLPSSAYGAHDKEEDAVSTECLDDAIGLKSTVAAGTSTAASSVGDSPVAGVAGHSARRYQHGQPPELPAVCSSITFRSLCSTTGTNRGRIEDGKVTIAPAADDAEGDLPTIALKLPGAARHAASTVAKSQSGSTAPMQGLGFADLLANLFRDAEGREGRSLFHEESGVSSQHDETDFEDLTLSLSMPCASLALQSGSKMRGLRGGPSVLERASRLLPPGESLAEIMPAIAAVGAAVHLLKSKPRIASIILRRQFGSGQLSKHGKIAQTMQWIDQSSVSRDLRFAIATVLLQASCNLVAAEISQSIEAMLWIGCAASQGRSFDTEDVTTTRSDNLDSASRDLLRFRLSHAWKLNCGYHGSAVGGDASPLMESRRHVVRQHSIATVDTYGGTRKSSFPLDFDSRDTKAYFGQVGSHIESSTSIDSVSATGELEMCKCISSAAMQVSEVLLGGSMPKEDQLGSGVHTQIVLPGRRHLSSQSASTARVDYLVQRSTLQSAGAIDAIAETAGLSCRLHYSWLQYLDRLADPGQLVPCISPAKRKSIQRASKSIALLKSKLDAAKRKEEATNKGDAAATAALHRALVSAGGRQSGEIRTASLPVEASRSSYYAAIRKAWMKEHLQTEDLPVDQDRSHPFSNLASSGLLDSVEYSSSGPTSQVASVSRTSATKLGLFRDTVLHMAASRIQATLRGLQLRKMIQSRSSCAILLRSALQHAAELFQEEIKDQAGKVVASPPGLLGSTIGQRGARSRSLTQSNAGQSHTVSRLQVDREIRLALQRIRPLPDILQPSGLTWAAKRVLLKMSRQNRLLKEVRECEKLDVSDAAVYDRLATALDAASDSGLSARDEIIRAQRRRQSVFGKMEARRGLQRALKAGRVDDIRKGLIVYRRAIDGVQLSGVSKQYLEQQALLDAATSAVKLADRVEHGLSTSQAAVLAADWLPGDLSRMWACSFHHEGSQEWIKGDCAPAPEDRVAILSPRRGTKGRRRRRRSQYEEMLNLKSVFESDDPVSADIGDSDTNADNSRRQVSPGRVQEGTRFEPFVGPPNRFAASLLLDYASKDMYETDRNSSSLPCLFGALRSHPDVLACAKSTDRLIEARDSLREVVGSTSGTVLDVLQRAERMTFTMNTLIECRKALQTGDRNRLSRELARAVSASRHFFSPLYEFVGLVSLPVVHHPVHSVEDTNETVATASSDATNDSDREGSVEQLEPCSALELFYLLLQWQVYRSSELIAQVLSDPLNRVTLDRYSLGELRLPLISVPDRSMESVAGCLMVSTQPTDSIWEACNRIASFYARKKMSKSTRHSQSVRKQFTFDEVSCESGDSDDESGSGSPVVSGMQVDQLLDSLDVVGISDPSGNQSSTNTQTLSRGCVDVLAGACVVRRLRTGGSALHPILAQDAVLQYGQALLEQQRGIENHKRRLQRDRGAEFPVSPRRSVVPALRRGATALLRRRASMRIAGTVGSQWQNGPSRIRRPAIAVLSSSGADQGMEPFSRVSYPLCSVEWLFNAAMPPWCTFSVQPGKSLLLPPLRDQIDLCVALMLIKHDLRTLESLEGVDLVEILPSTSVALPRNLQNVRLCMKRVGGDVESLLQSEMQQIEEFGDHMLLLKDLATIFQEQQSAEHVSSDRSVLHDFLRAARSSSLGTEYSESVGQSRGLRQAWDILRLFCHLVQVGAVISDIEAKMEIFTSPSGGMDFADGHCITTSWKAGGANSAAFLSVEDFADDKPLKRVGVAVGRSHALPGSMSPLGPKSEPSTRDFQSSRSRQLHLQHSRTMELLAEFDTDLSRFDRIKQGLRSHAKSSHGKELPIEIAVLVVSMVDLAAKEIHDKISSILLSDALEKVRDACGRLPSWADHAIASTKVDSRCDNLDAIKACLLAMHRVQSMSSLSAHDASTHLSRLNSGISTLVYCTEGWQKVVDARLAMQQHGIEVVVAGVVACVSSANQTLTPIEGTAREATSDDALSRLSTTMITEISAMHGSDSLCSEVDLGAGFADPDWIQLCQIASGATCVQSSHPDVQGMRNVCASSMASLRKILFLVSMRQMFELLQSATSISAWTTARQSLLKLLPGLDILSTGAYERPFMRHFDLSWGWVGERSSTRPAPILALLDAMITTPRSGTLAPSSLLGQCFKLQSLRLASGKTSCESVDGSSLPLEILRTTESEDQAMFLLECSVALLGQDLTSSDAGSLGNDDWCVDPVLMARWLARIKSIEGLQGVQWLAQVLASKSLWNNVSDGIIYRVQRARQFCMVDFVHQMLPAKASSVDLEFEAAAWWLVSSWTVDVAGSEILGQRLVEQIMVGSASLRSLSRQLELSDTGDSPDVGGAEASVYSIISIHAELLSRFGEVSVKVAYDISKGSVAGGLSRAQSVVKKLGDVLADLLPLIHRPEVQKARDNPIGATVLDWLTKDFAVIAGLIEVLDALHEIFGSNCHNSSKEQSILVSLARRSSVAATPIARVCNWLVGAIDIQSSFARLQQFSAQHVQLMHRSIELQTAGAPPTASGLRTLLTNHQSKFVRCVWRNRGLFERAQCNVADTTEDTSYAPAGPSSLSAIASTAIDSGSNTYSSDPDIGARSTGVNSPMFQSLPPLFAQRTRAVSRIEPQECSILLESSTKMAAQGYTQSNPDLHISISQCENASSHTPTDMRLSRLVTGTQNRAIGSQSSQVLSELFASAAPLVGTLSSRSGSDLSKSELDSRMVTDFGGSAAGRIIKNLLDSMMQVCASLKTSCVADVVGANYRRCVTGSQPRFDLEAVGMSQGVELSKITGYDLIADYSGLWMRHDRPVSVQECAALQSITGKPLQVIEKASDSDRCGYLMQACSLCVMLHVRIWAGFHLQERCEQRQEMRSLADRAFTLSSQCFEPSPRDGNSLLESVAVVSLYNSIGEEGIRSVRKELTLLSMLSKRLLSLVEVSIHLGIPMHKSILALKAVVNRVGPSPEMGTSALSRYVQQQRSIVDVSFLGSAEICLDPNTVIMQLHAQTRRAVRDAVQSRRSKETIASLVRVAKTMGVFIADLCQSSQKSFLQYRLQFLRSQQQFKNF